MSSFVVKPERDEDFYVVWSSIVEAPLAFGDRAYVGEYLSEHDPGARFGSHSIRARLDRADETGTSALWPSTSDPFLGYQDDGVIYQQQGILPRERLVELCRRLDENEHADVSDLLEPFDA